MVNTPATAATIILVASPALGLIPAAENTRVRIIQIISVRSPRVGYEKLQNLMRLRVLTFVV